MQVHYLGDPGRGSVWEETIINCPPHIRLLAMSATIANAHDLGGWISQAGLPTIMAALATSNTPMCSSWLLGLPANPAVFSASRRCIVDLAYHGHQACCI